MATYIESCLWGTEQDSVSLGGVPIGRLLLFFMNRLLLFDNTGGIGLGPGVCSSLRSQSSSSASVISGKSCSMFVLDKLTRPWDAAKHMESAAALAKELSNWREVADFYQKASELYMECGRPQPASDALAKGARALEDTMPEEAIQLYTDAITILEDDEKEQMAFDLYRAVTSVYIKLEKYTDAASSLLRLGLAADKCNATNSQTKAYLSAIIVYLYAHDFKQAEQCYNDCSQIDAFLKSDHSRCAGKFLSAYTDGDVDEIKKIAQSSAVSHLDHAIIRLARKLPTGDVSSLKAVTAGDDEEPLDENDLT
ncbi:hypothetical protein TSUD_406280 [Trifolium subterraneum]|uniref:Gamma-soluble NSF attachment protein n=2 Tax=Trifolium TaxID=3898 RepID=A0A2Z6PG87_TRISU|nr:hypothetical protein TSUD_406280 [Trifolium subterraneum]